MAKVNCPGCQSLVTFDPKEETEFPCPACGKQLRVKKPVKAVPAFAPKPKPIAVATVREPVEKEEEEEDEPRPIRKKKRRRSRGPSGEVSVLLMPLGGVAVLLILAVAFYRLNTEGEARGIQLGLFSYAVLIIEMAIGLAIGGAATMYAVNSLAKRKKVPEIDFIEAAFLYPLVAFSGGMGLGMAIGFVIWLFTDNSKPKSIDGPGFMPLFLGVVGGVLAFIAAGAPIIKFLLNTAWKDAFSIAVRFFLVFLLLTVTLWFSLGLLVVILNR